MHSDCDLSGSGTVSPTHTWQFYKESSALGHLDLMSVTQKWAVLRKNVSNIFPTYKFTAMMWNKPTELSDFLSFMSQIDVIILQHLQFRETLFLFSSQLTQKPLGLLQPRTMLNINVSRKTFNDGQMSPFHMTQRKTQKCMTRSQQTGHQLCLGDRLGQEQKWEIRVPAQLSKTPCRWCRIRKQGQKVQFATEPPSL